MKYTSFLIKYAEIAIKGKNRYMFEDALIRQIKIALNKCEGKYQVTKTSGRIYVEYYTDYDFDDTVSALTKVFGITGVCPVVHVEDKGFEQLASDVTAFVDEVYPDKKKTFKVNSRRARKNYPLESMEINAKLGEVLLDAFPDLSVDVHNPEIMLNVEIREKIYIYSQVIPGPGGMPIGTNGKAMLLLSGGIDSTLTVSLMQSLSENPIRTFTIGFDNEKYNEACYAAETAKHLGTNHTEMYVTRDDILGVIDKIPLAYTEPFADSSQIPTMLVSEMTKQHVTVSLSGDAGDEFYCGYNSYKDVRRGLDILAGKLPMLKGKARVNAGKMVLNLGGKNSQLLHTIASVLMTDTPENWYRHNRDDNILVSKLHLNRLQFADSIDSYQDGYLDGAEANLMLMDMLQYLPDDILVKVDRAGMFYSLESRIPLLDRDVMEFAWTLPQEYKYDGVTTKRILKDILYRYVPKEMMDRPKKGFSVPLESWLRGEELNSWANDMLQSAKVSMGEYVDYKIVDKMWKNFLATGENERDMWNILMLAQWFTHRK